MIETPLLADHPGAIPTLAAWFRAQWPDYYAQRSLTDIARDFREEARRDGLPLRLLALVDGELAGTIVLRDRALTTLPESHPGLGGLFVTPRHRARGVGSALVRAGMDAARAQGFAVVYATTAVAGGILARQGWVISKAVVEHNDEQLALYRCELKPRGQTGQ